MPLRTIATFAIAIILGLVAVLLVRGYMGSAQKPAVSAPGAVAGATPVVVAATPLVRGATLQATALKVVNFPTGSVPQGAFTDIAQLSGTGSSARVTLRSIAANEPILASRVSAPGGKPILSGALTTGMRAISVRTSDVAGVGGFIMPGDRVDILVTRTTSTTGNEAVTQIMAQGIRVLGVDQSDDVDADKPVVAKVITLEVTPEEAQAISLAQSVGSLVLSLRASADDAPLARRAMTTADLGYGGPRAAAPTGRAASQKVAVVPAKEIKAAPDAPSSPAEKTPEVRVVRGVSVSTYPVSAN